MDSDHRLARALEAFRELCDLDAHERDARLREVEAEDPRLAAEIRALLAEDEAPASAFDDAAIAVGRAALEGVLEGGEPAPLPETIGSYRVLSLLGEGGMGLVYEAEQDSPRRRVALKVVHPAALTEARLARLRHEAEILGRFRHPGIAAIHEAGTDDLGRGAQPFFAMEYVDGTDVVTFARERGLGRHDVLRLFLRLCDAVQHAHEAGVVHRDLKPENVLVRADGQPVVLDFGVARSHVAGPAGTMGTREGSLVGTLAYMSPEQAAGEVDVDARADVYSLGVVLYELLSGSQPLDLGGRSLLDALDTKRRELPRPLRSIAPDVDRDLAVIVHKALEPDPTRRYGSALELQRDLQRYDASEPILARPPSLLYQLGKLARRHRVAVAGAALTALALVIGTAVSLAFAVDAVRSEERARREAYVSRLEAASSSLASGAPSRTRASLLATDPDLRGWEWHHLWSQVDGLGFEFEGRVRGDCEPLVLEDSGLVLAPEGNEIVAWDIESGSRRRAWPTGSPVVCVSDRAVEGRIAYGTESGSVGVLRLETGVAVELSLGGDEPVVDVLWSEAAGCLVAAQGRRLFAIPVALDPQEDGIGTANEVGVRGSNFVNLTLQPDGRAALGTVMQGGASRLVRYLLPGGEPDGSSTRDRARLAHGAVFSPDGTRLFVGGDYGVAAIFDAATLELLHRLENQSGLTRAATWSDDGARLVSLDHSGCACVRDGTTGAPLAFLNVGATDAGGARSRRYWCRFLPGGARLLVRAGERLSSWPVDVRPAAVLEGHRRYAYNARFSEEADLVVSRSYRGDMIVWDALEQRELGRVAANGAATDLWIRGERIGARQSKRLRRFDLATLEEVENSGAADDEDRDAELLDPRLARSPGGTYAINARQGRLVDTRTGERVAEFKVSGTNTAGAAFHPDGTRLVLATDRARIYAVPGGELVAELDGHAGAVYCADYSPDGERLALGGADGTITLWDARTHEHLLTLSGHNNYVRSVAWSADGTRLVSASGDTTVRIWDSVPQSARRVERVRWRELKDDVRPVVDAALDRGDGATAAATLRADAGLPPGSERRRAALRVLLARVRRGG